MVINKDGLLVGINIPLGIFNTLPFFSLHKHDIHDPHKFM